MRPPGMQAQGFTPKSAAPPSVIAERLTQGMGLACCRQQQGDHPSLNNGIDRPVSLTTHANNRLVLRAVRSLTKSN